MIIRPPGSSRERILVWGMAGTGKTTGWLTALAATEGEAWVLDTDDAVTRMLETAWSHLADRVHVTVPEDWPDWTRWVKEAVERAGPDDWIVVDMISAGWDVVQAYYISEVMGTEPGDYFLHARQSRKSGQPLDGWKDWSVINKMWSGFMATLRRSKAHVYVTCSTKQDESADDWGPWGLRPAGQRDLPHQFASVLHFRRAGRSWAWWTSKDWGRPMREQVSWEDFALSYLVGVARWLPKQ